MQPVLLSDAAAIKVLRAASTVLFDMTETSVLVAGVRRLFRGGGSSVESEPWA
jgi:hypothetical protein